METRRVSFDVALLHPQQANGPAVYLAQAEGLGFQADNHLGLKARPLASQQQSESKSGLWPFLLPIQPFPSPLGWTRKTAWALPLKNEIATSKRVSEVEAQAH